MDNPKGGDPLLEIYYQRRRFQCWGKINDIFGTWDFTERGNKDRSIANFIKGDPERTGIFLREVNINRRRISAKFVSRLNKQRANQGGNLTWANYKEAFSRLAEGDIKGYFNSKIWDGDIKVVDPFGGGGKVGAVVLSGSKSIRPILYTVYKGITENGGVYWGMTKNFAQRAAQHGDRFVSVVEVHVGIAGRGAARGVEQLMIDAAGGIKNLENTINSIGVKNPQLMKYYQEAVRF
nr:hypothetical protein [Pedobacter panaciterrae]